jgi:hypothetical protein
MRPGFPVQLSLMFVDWVLRFESAWRAKRRSVLGIFNFQIDKSHTQAPAREVTCFGQTMKSQSKRSGNLLKETEPNQIAFFFPIMCERTRPAFHSNRILILI